jgi:hypothetical protein
MKTTKIRLAAIIVLLLVFFMSYLQLRQYNSYRIPIHNKADVIIKINVEGIYKKLALDLISHPFYYSNKEKGEKTDENKKGNGVEIPANVFLYSVSAKSASTFFCSLPVTDTVIFKSFIIEKLHISSLKKISATMFSGTSKDGKLTVAYTADNMAIAYSVRREKVLDILTDILNRKNVLPVSDIKIKKLKQVSNDVDYVSSTGFGSMNFKNGEINLSAEITSDSFFMIGKKITHRQFSAESTMKMWLNAPIHNQIKNTVLSVKNYTFQTDSLLKDYKGYLDAEWLNTITQTDSVITYDYNDNFEKVEKLSTAQVQVPGITISLKTNAEPLLKYLKDQNAIKNDHAVNKQLFPLYSVYSSKSAGYLQFSTKKGDGSTAKEESSDYFFFLEINFDKIRSQNQFPLLNSYIGNSSLLTAKAKKIKAKTILIESSIDLKNKEVNSLPQFLDQFH